MKEIFLIHQPAHDAEFIPMTILAQARLTLHEAWSTRDGGTRPVYRSPSGDLFVGTLGWTKTEALAFAGIFAAEVTTVELPDEEADAVIATINRNLIGRTPS